MISFESTTRFTPRSATVRSEISPAVLKLISSVQFTQKDYKRALRFLIHETGRIFSEEHAERLAQMLAANRRNPKVRKEIDDKLTSSPLWVIGEVFVQIGSRNYRRARLKHQGVLSEKRNTSFAPVASVTR